MSDFCFRHSQLLLVGTSTGLKRLFEHILNSKTAMSISFKARLSPPHLQNLSANRTHCQMDIYNINVDNIGSIFTASVVLCVFDTVLGFAAIVANGLVIWAIVSRPALHSPSNILLCCLAFADFLTGAITQPAFVVSIAARLLGAYSLYCKASLASYFPVYFLSGVSFLTLTASTVERYLALHLHLRYQQVITTKRVFQVEATIWIALVPIVCLPIFFPFIIFEITVSAIIALSLVVNAWLYTTIAMTVRRHMRRVLAEEELAVHFHGNSAAETRKVRRSSITIAGMFLVCSVCYVPTICVMIVSTSQHHYFYMPIARLARDIAASIVFCHSVFNPLLVCYREKDIRRTVIDILKKITL